MNPTPQPRSHTPEPPYCWQSKIAHRIICEHFDGDTFGCSVLGTYTALCVLASDNQAETFTAPQSCIAQKSCLGLTTVRKALKELRQLGLIAYETPKLRGQITFTLLTTRGTLLSKRRTLLKVRNHRPLSTLEESKKESVEEDIEESLVETREQESSPPSSATGSATSTDSSSCCSVSVAGLSFADRFRATLAGKVSLVVGWREKWARAYDDLLRLDKREVAEIERVWQWARGDPFWSAQFLSPLKLRKRNREGVTYYDLFLAKLNGAQPHRRRKDPPI